MKVLIACEFSGIVRDAFAARGHDAVSCDLLQSERPGPHLRSDVWPHLNFEPWDMLIAHPPCTYLCNSGVRWLYKGETVRAEVLHRSMRFEKRVRDPARWQAMEQARDFFIRLWHAPIKYICVENPIPHKHAQLPPYTQIIQPWQFGHGESKATCLWLKNLPPLQPTKIVEGRTPRVHYASPGPERWKERSRTLTGIAEAMAEQWGK